MSETKLKLNADQMDRFARLLVNFSSDTANIVLNRFDRDTRNRIRSNMSDLSYSGCSSDEESLAEFAEFLYFEPDDNISSKETVTHDPTQIRKPQLDSSSPNRASNVSGKPGLSFQDVVGFSDLSLESLLKAAPPELTIAMLTCSPESFVRRVLGKLSASESRVVQQQINQTNTVDFSEMQKIHQRYCDFATYMIDNGLMSK